MIGERGGWGGGGGGWGREVRGQSTIEIADFLNMITGLRSISVPLML